MFTFIKHYVPFHFLTQGFVINGNLGAYFFFLLGQLNYPRMVRPIE